MVLLVSKYESLGTLFTALQALKRKAKSSSDGILKTDFFKKNRNNKLMLILFWVKSLLHIKLAFLFSKVHHLHVNQKPNKIY